MDEVKEIFVKTVYLTKIMEINPERYFDSTEAGVTMPLRLTPGVTPESLHYGMFKTTVEKIGSDE